MTAAGWRAPDLGDAGVLAPGRLRRFRALGWMLLLTAAVGLVASLPEIVRIDGGPFSLGAAGLAYLLYAAAVRFGERRAPTEIALRPLVSDLVLGVAIGLAMFTAVIASLRLLGACTLAPGDWTDWLADAMRDTVTGLEEELILRLIVFRLLMRALGLWPALALSAALFGAAHLANPNASAVAAVAIAVEAGLMLAAFYLLTGRIWTSVGVHAAWNFAQGPIFGARVSGFVEHGSLFVSAPAPGAPAWISGGAFGPEASAPAMLIGLAVFAAAMRGAYRRGA
ncbi:MAG TPA: CPBP family intramembrane glutamic endopeptidase [Sphingomonas sp.]